MCFALIDLLIDLVHQELSLADQFSKFKIPHNIIKKLLSIVPPSESNMFRVDFRSTHVHYLNNLEEDAMYKRWRSNINEILMPVYPGQLRYIRKNLFHAVYVLDPATVHGLQACFPIKLLIIIDMITSLYENNFPVRFGVILYSTKFINKIEINGGELQSSALEDDSEVKEDTSSLIIRLFSYIKENYGTQTAFQFLSNVNRLRMESEDSEDDALEMHLIEGAFVETIVPKAKSPPQDLLLKLEKEQSLKEKSQEISMFVFKLGLAKLQSCLLMNGLVFDSNEEALINAMNDELPRIQEQVYYGHISSRTDVLDKFLSENGISRYNPQIIADAKVKPRFISLASSILGGESWLKDVNYLHSPETMDDVKPVTHLLAVDVMSKKGIKLLREGIHFLIRGSKVARLGVLFSASQEADSSSLLLVKAFEITASTYSHKKKVLEFLDQLCLYYERTLAFPVSAKSTQAFIDKISEFAEANGLSSKVFISSLPEYHDGSVRKYLNKVVQFLYRELGVEPGINAVITNGRVMSPIDVSTFLSHDLDLLESVEFKHRIKYVWEIIEGTQGANPEQKKTKKQPILIAQTDPGLYKRDANFINALCSKFVSDIIMLVSSALAMRERGSESARFEILSAEHSAVVLNSENSVLHIDAVIDPLSPTGQKLSSILRVLQKYTRSSMRIVLNPVKQNGSKSIVLIEFWFYVMFIIIWSSSRSCSRLA
ncbi:hypothetical protein Pint_33129 [Pistacia integerrima]|uniref:Uncharacterized protein n=1 Tax=Pistacia integerrima TaxID=434235 RepID=A0ACC0X882_9ROSI|nr:hypothetical protein Pint_33129 [Pistacia integerrima]